MCVFVTGAVRASSLFPILSEGLLFVGGVCVAASEFYKSRHTVILSAGIFFVSAGMSICSYKDFYPVTCRLAPLKAAGTSVSRDQGSEVYLHSTSLASVTYAP